MAKARQNDSSSRSSQPLRPALTPEGRQNQLIGLAMDNAEEQLRNGTASSQVITHFLKLGSIQAELELEKLRRENELLTAKTESLQSSKRIEELYAEAIKAMATYAGHGERDEFDDEY